MIKRYWRMLTIIKDTLLINSFFLVNFWAKAINISNYLQNKLLIKYFRHIFISKKHRIEIDIIFNIFTFLIVEQILLY